MSAVNAACVDAALARPRPSTTLARIALLVLTLGALLASSLVAASSSAPARAAGWYTSAPAEAKRYPTLQFGSRGVAVAYVQKRLLLTPTGFYNRTTERIVKLWESRNGMAPDGRITKGNWIALLVPYEGSAAASTTGWVRPLPSMRVIGRFGARGSMWSSGRHTGTDFRASSGTSVYAAAAGRIVSARYAGAYGYRVAIRHSGGVETWYCHLSRIVKSSGSVRAGQLIGRAGSTGNSFGAHLHMEVRRGGNAVDPVAYLKARGVRF